VRPVKNFILVEILNEYGYRYFNADFDSPLNLLVGVAGYFDSAFPLASLDIFMTVYETLQLFFMAMVFGSLTGFVYGTWLYWVRD